MDFLITYIIGGAIVLFFMIVYLRGQKKRQREWHAAADKGKLFSEGPKAQHPQINSMYCIGCGTCSTVCPEGDVLGLVGGQAAIINGYKCIGHGLCAEACPVGAITMSLANPSLSAELPALSPEYETGIPGLFIVGELGGLALIKNAVNQGRDCIDAISQRTVPCEDSSNVYDVLIVGAGPAGISASLRAIENKLKYITIEQDQVGGTVAKYPRQKLVMTTPVEFPMYGKFRKMELSKENLLEFWHKVMERADFRVRSGEKVEDISKSADGVFSVVTSKDSYRARNVVLALGRTGTPRKLGIPGEDLPKVMYRLIEADHYVNKNILVVGGGDSAVEAAMGLAHQIGNQVTLSYRQSHFNRIKARNEQRINDASRSGKVRVIFNSNPVEIRPDSVVLNVGDNRVELPNDYTWIFAGGEPPNAFLKKIGVQLGSSDLTSRAHDEAVDLSRSKYRALDNGQIGVTD